MTPDARPIGSPRRAGGSGEGCDRRRHDPAPNPVLARDAFSGRM